MPIALGAILLLLPAGGRAAADEVHGLPPRALLWRDEAQRRYASGDLSGALKALLSARAVAPGSAQLQFMVGNARFRLGKFRESVGDYLQAAALRPEHPDTWLSLGFALFYSGRRDSAVVAWERAVHLSPETAMSRLALACGYEAQGNGFFAGLQLMTAIALDSTCRSMERLKGDIRWRPDTLSLLDAVIPAEPPGD